MLMIKDYLDLNSQTYNFLLKNRLLNILYKDLRLDAYE